MKALFVLNDPPYGTGGGHCLPDGRSGMDQLAAVTVSADKVLVF